MDNSDNTDQERNAECQGDTNAMMKTTEGKHWWEVCTESFFILDGEGTGKPFEWNKS